MVSDGWPINTHRDYLPGHQSPQIDHELSPRWHREGKVGGRVDPHSTLDKTRSTTPGSNIEWKTAAIMAFQARSGELYASPSPTRPTTLDIQAWGVVYKAQCWPSRLPPVTRALGSELAKSSRAATASEKNWNVWPEVPSVIKDTLSSTVDAW